MSNLAPNLEITSDHWAIIQKAYGGLFKDIARKIYKSDQSPEDLVSEIQIKVLKVLRSYCIKYNLSIDDALKDDIFPKFLKTSLWNWRNTKCKLTIRHNLTFKKLTGVDENNTNVKVSKQSSTGDHGFADIVDPKSSIIFAELNFHFDRFKLNEMEGKIVDLILSDGKCYKFNNSINKAYLVSMLGIANNTLDNCLQSIKNKIEVK